MIDLFKRLAEFVQDANYRRLQRRREPARIAYQQWVRDHDALTPERLAALEARYQRLQNRPLISVIMPVYNANLDWLLQAVESLQAQVYQEWELCVADDCSTQDGLRQALTELPCRDARIKVVFRQTNGHISAASNSAIELATGRFLALMDQDDLLSPYALLEMAEAIAQCPDAGLLYSDEDKIDELNRREGPTQKGPWHPGQLLKYNRICHLGLYRTDLVRAVGGFRVGFEGAQDHDLALRCTEQLEPRQIVYVPKVLYHWRMHAQSTAASRRAKPYAIQARQRCLAEHRSRQRARA